MIARFFLLVIVCFTSVFAFFDQKYEPSDGRIIHGLGQYVNLIYYSDQDNWDLVEQYQNGTGKIPLIYSVYAYTDPYADRIDTTDFADITQNHGHPYILLIGISLFDSTSTTSSVNIPVNDFLNGDLDDQIRKIAIEIKNLGSPPVFVRPGYEFGTGNSGLHNDDDNPDWTAENFITIWKRIYDIFAEESLTNVAWVWNTVNPQSFDFSDWYPGDAYVDWWGINYFTTSQMQSASAFLDSAYAHQKPVMVCESCPISDGGTTNADNWNNWFVPYFDTIENETNLKAFVYISDPWDRPGFFDSWPDSRIDSDPTILANYSNQISDSSYIHMDEYVSNPGVLDSSLPVTLISFKVQARGDVNWVRWETASELENAGFNIYRATAEHEPADLGELHFIKINKSLIPGNGNTSQSNSYFFPDSQVLDEHYYWYQLEQLDISGKRIRYDLFKLFRKAQTPEKIRLFQNYPNPCNGRTKIKFSLCCPEHVNLALYSVNGERVKYLLNKTISEGEYEVFIDTASLADGVYFYRIQSSTKNICKKMVVLK